MSKQTDNEYLGRFLNADELLKSKGIRCVTWEEWEKASTSLPKLGQKQYEPNGSWLENNVIENGLNIRKDLLNLEKVDRIYNLATAEWLPHQKKAKVTKTSGQDWSSFGHTINSELYLIPEEALLLLEMNSLELYWNGVPFSIQQAYEILFESSDDAEYTLDHYRVYRQLVKEGYHLQRYIKKPFSDSRYNVGKKVIVEPENGLRLAKSVPTPVDVEMKDLSNTTETINQEEKGNASNKKSSLINNNSESTKTADIKVTANDPVQETENNSNKKSLNDDVLKMEICEDANDVTNKKESETVNDKNESSTNGDGKKSKKVEIISDEIVLDTLPITVMNSTKWPGTRIQRNVKLMPKRVNKVPVNNADGKDITVINSSEGNSKRGEKRGSNGEHSSNKKSREEVIDISDDDDKSVTRPLTRMELLDKLPNLASNPVTVVKINRAYIPHSIKPQKDVYYYRKAKWISNQNNNPESPKSNTSSVPYRENSQQRVVTNVYNNAINQQRPQQNYGYFQQQINRFGHQAQQWFSRNTFFQQNISHFGQRHMFNYQSTFNFNVFGVMQNMMRSIHMSVRYRNPFQSTLQQNVQFSYQQTYFNNRNNYHWRPQINPNHPNFKRNTRKSSDVVDITSNEEVNKPSFNKLPNVSSWTELKDKWLEEKTITLDDDDPNELDGEIQVLKQSAKPLLKVSGPMNFGEIYEKLRIIKSAPDVGVRKKSSDYTLSYSVYSNNQPYKKSNPGTPAYRVLVIRAQKSQHMDLKKLSRLQQEMKEVPIIIAYVTNTIVFIQPGFVSLPNWY